ncbi:UNVERIFIED_CONTAM: hypothetical protein FKN15_052940 [Acipenser sinensis]
MEVGQFGKGRSYGTRAQCPRRPFGIALLVCIGCAEDMCKYWCMSVGLQKRDDVHEFMRELDGSGLVRRRAGRKRIERRNYFSHGPNDSWHIDGTTNMLCSVDDDLLTYADRFTCTEEEPLSVANAAFRQICTTNMLCSVDDDLLTYADRFTCTEEEPLSAANAAFRQILPWEDAVDEAYKRGWRVQVYPVEVGCQGFVTHSTTRFLRDVGFSGQELHRTVKNLSEAAERSSNWLWLRRKDSGWGSQAQ